MLATVRLQAFSLFVVVVIPFGTAMTMLAFRMTYVGFGILVGIVVTWVPTVNPVSMASIHRKERMC